MNWDNFNSQKEYNEFIKQEGRIIILAKQSEEVVRPIMGRGKRKVSK